MKAGFKGISREARVAMALLLAMLLCAAAAFCAGCAGLFGSGDEPQEEAEEVLVSEEPAGDDWPVEFNKGSVDFPWGSIDLDALGDDMFHVVKVSESQAYFKYVSHNIPVGRIGTNLTDDDVASKAFTLGRFDGDGLTGVVELRLFMPGDNDSVGHFVGVSDKLVLTKVVKMTPATLVKCILLKQGKESVPAQLAMVEDNRFVPEESATTVLSDPYNSGFGESSSSSAAAQAPDPAQQPQVPSDQAQPNPAAPQPDQGQQGAGQQDSTQYPYLPPSQQYPDTSSQGDSSGYYQPDSGNNGVGYDGNGFYTTPDNG